MDSVIPVRERFNNYPSTSREYYIHKLGTAVFLSLIIGTAAFLLLVGPRALQPTNIVWLQNTDAVSSYLAWKFFAHSPWGIPFGVNPEYGLEFSSSIFYSDSIPLLALIVKLLGVSRNGEFQYFGIWLLACFCLQFLAGYLLAGRITKRTWLRAIMATFFVFAPIMVWRLYGHYALVGQFLVLFALYLNLTNRQGPSLIAWPLLITVAALTHAYILAMVLPLWGSDIIRRFYRQDTLTREALTEAMAVVAVLVLSLWAAGFFVNSGGFAEGGFGLYRMDILSPLNPMGWSHILRDLPSDPGEYEGFNFIGTGMLLAILLLLAARVGGGRMPLGPLGLSAPLLAVLCVLTLVALTNRPSLGPWQLVIPLPEAVLTMLSVVRASGRFFWPVIYLVFLLTFLVAVRTYGERRAGAVLAVCLVIQIVDTSAAWHNIRGTKMVKPSSRWGDPGSNLADNAFWSIASKHYANIRTVPQGTSLLGWNEISLAAANNGMGSTAATLARIDPMKWVNAQKKMAADIESATYEPDSIYVLDNGWALRTLLSLDPSRDILTRVDGLNVLVPDYGRCGDCPPLKPLQISNFAAEVSIGTDIMFSAGSSGAISLLGGWSIPEAWGTWTVGKNSHLILPLPAGADTNTKPMRLSINAQGLLGKGHPSQTVTVSVNGVTVGQIRFDNVHNRGSRTLPVPLSVLTRGRQGIIDVSFEIEQPVRPTDLGMGPDNRELGMGLIAMRLDAEP
jgi:hypothetical protein